MKKHSEERSVSLTDLLRRDRLGIHRDVPKWMPEKERRLKRLLHFARKRRTVFICGRPHIGVDFGYISGSTPYPIKEFTPSDPENRFEWAENLERDDFTFISVEDWEQD